MKKQLLFSVTKKDLDIRWFSGSGSGGQHRNKHANCCEIKHKASGASGIGTESKSREQNQKAAFRRMVASKRFESWRRMTAATLSGSPTPEEIVEQYMSDPEGFKIEVKENDKWQEATEKELS